MTSRRLKLIRDAAKRDVSAEEFRDRLDEWMGLRTPEYIKILWQKTVDVYEQSAGFWGRFEKTK